MDFSKLNVEMICYIKNVFIPTRAETAPLGVRRRRPAVVPGETRPQAAAGPLSVTKKIWADTAARPLQAPAFSGLSASGSGGPVGGLTRERGTVHLLPLRHVLPSESGCRGRLCKIHWFLIKGQSGKGNSSGVRSQRKRCEYFCFVSKTRLQERISQGNKRNEQFISFFKKTT